MEGATAEVVLFETKLAIDEENISVNLHFFFFATEAED